MFTVMNIEACYVTWFRFIAADAKQFASEQDALFFETSARSGKNIHEVFNAISMPDYFVSALLFSIVELVNEKLCIE
jgi:hypothetical protein